MRGYLSDSPLIRLIATGETFHDGLRQIGKSR